MGTALHKEQMVEQELLDRVTKAPDVGEPSVPPPRRQLLRWVLWATFVAVAAVIAAAFVASILNSDTEIPADVSVVDEAQSSLTIGARQIDPSYQVPARWVGAALEGTAEEMANVNPAIAGSDLYPNPEAVDKVEITGRLGPQRSVLYPSPEAVDSVEITGWLGPRRSALYPNPEVGTAEWLASHE